MRTIIVLDDVAAMGSDQTTTAGHTEDGTIQGGHQTYTKCERSITHPMHFGAYLYRGKCLSVFIPLAKLCALYSLLLYGIFFIVCSRNVEGAEGGSRTHRDGAYLSVLRLRWWRALRRSMRSVQPRCSQGAPTPSLFLSSVSIGVVLLASG